MDLKSFQGYIAGILTKKLDVFDIIYLADILLYINEISYIDFV